MFSTIVSTAVIVIIVEISLKVQTLRIFFSFSYFFQLLFSLLRFNEENAFPYRKIRLRTSTSIIPKNPTFFDKSSKSSNLLGISKSAMQFSSFFQRCGKVFSAFYNLFNDLDLFSKHFLTNLDSLAFAVTTYSSSCWSETRESVNHAFFCVLRTTRTQRVT